MLSTDGQPYTHRQRVNSQYYWHVTKLRKVIVIFKGVPCVFSTCTSYCTNFMTFIPSLTFTELWVVSMEHMQRVWLASRERLPFRTPGSVPHLGLANAPIVETKFLELAMSLLDFSPRIPLGTFSILPLITRLQEMTVNHTHTTCCPCRISDNCFRALRGNNPHTACSHYGWSRLPHHPHASRPHVCAVGEPLLCHAWCAWWGTPRQPPHAQNHHSAYRYFRLDHHFSRFWRSRVLRTGHLNCNGEVASSQKRFYLDVHKSMRETWTW